MKRVLTTSGVSDGSNGSSGSNFESVPSSTTVNNLREKVSMSFMRVPPTVVHRTPPKPRPSIISIREAAAETLGDVSPLSSAETSGNSGKSSVPDNQYAHSTGKTSQDSKSLGQLKKVSGQSSENKKSNAKLLAAEGSSETALTPIQELDAPYFAPEPVPSKSSTKMQM
jgi:hypothetical protein